MPHEPYWTEVDPNTPWTRVSDPSDTWRDSQLLVFLDVSLFNNGGLSVLTTVTSDEPASPASDPPDSVSWSQVSDPSDEWRAQELLAFLEPGTYNEIGLVVVA